MIWRSGNKLVCARKGAYWPDVCVRTNEPAHGERVKLRLSWHHPAIYLFLLLGALPYIIAGSIARKSAVVEVGVTAAVKKSRFRARAGGLTLFFLGIPLMLIGGSSEMMPLFLTGLIALPIGFVWYLMYGRLLTASRMDDRLVWLKGAKPSYLDQFPVFGSEQQSGSFTERGTIGADPGYVAPGSAAPAGPAQNAQPDSGVKPEGNKRVNVKAVVADIRGGLDRGGLKSKYGLSDDQVALLYAKLRERGLIP